MQNLFGDEQRDILDVMQQLGRDPREVAPVFCSQFGKNLYLVRKYLWGQYPFDPERTIQTGAWLFAPPQPSYLEKFMELERGVGATGYFTAALGGISYRRLQRVEMILNWARQTSIPKSSRPPRITKKSDLTAPDDKLVERTVAFVIATVCSLPAKAITFASGSGKKGRAADFQVRTPECSVHVEVKHFRKQPQSAAEQRWFELFSGRPCLVTKTGYPEDVLLEHAFTSQRAPDQLPWQITTKSVQAKLREAELQFPPQGGPKLFRMVVVHSDDPHVLTRPEKTETDEPTENRIESAVESWFRSAERVRTDAVVLLASPFGFPIESGYCCRAFVAEDAQCPLVQQLSRSLTKLAPLPMSYGLLYPRQTS